MPTSICGLTNGANLTGDEADIQGAMAQEGNNDSPQVMVATATPPPLPPPAPSNSGGFLSGLWSSISNTASNAWDEVTMVSSYVWNHPAEAVQEASTGANEGAALMLNQATFGTCFQEEARQAAQDLGTTTTQIVRFCGSTAEVCLLAAAAGPAAAPTVLEGAGIGMALDAGHQAAQIIDGTRDGFDLGELGGAGQVGAGFAVVGMAAPQVAQAAGLVMSAEAVVTGVEEISQGKTATGLFDVTAGSVGFLASTRSPARGGSAEEGGAAAPKGPGAGKLAAEEATVGEGAAGRSCARRASEGPAAADGRVEIGCFAAGTHLRTPMGSRAIEEFVPGDWVLSCAETEESGVVRPRQVLKVMKRLATLVRLRVGGQTIQTTAEHLFWARDQGWTSTRELRAGDLLRSHDGQWVELEGWEWTDRIEVVYNMEVEGDHTYFVGASGWGFSIWSHNQGECGGSTPAPAGKEPIQGSGGPGKVYEIPGSELESGKPYIGKTKQKTVADRMKNKDHRAKTPTGEPPKADVLAENLTEEEMAGVEALLIEQRGLDNLSNKIPGLNPELPKNQSRLDAGRRVLGQE